MFNRNVIDLPNKTYSGRIRFKHDKQFYLLRSSLTSFLLSCRRSERTFEDLDSG